MYIECAQDFLSIFTRGDLTPSVSNDTSADDVLATSDSTPPPPVQTCTSQRGSGRRPDRPTTLSRPLQLPTCCNFRRQPWTTYVHGEFSYSAAPRCYSGVEDELGAAADNEAVVKIIESLQVAGKQLCFSNGYHGDDINNPGVNRVNGNESKRDNNKTVDNHSASENAPKSSPQVAAVQLTTVSLASNAMETQYSNETSGVNGRYVNVNSQQNGQKLGAHAERSPTRQMQQDINQNLRPLDAAKHAADVVPETTSRRQTGTGSSRQRPESPATGRQQKSKSRRSRNRSLASRDERLANGGAERHQNQNGGRKSTRSRTLSPALTERFDYHVSRPVQTDPCRPEVARRDVIDVGGDSSSVCLRPGVHRKGRSDASEHIDNAVVSSLPAQSRRFVRLR